jgi:hypothetical protein
MQRFLTAAVLAVVAMSQSLVAQTAPPSDVVVGSGNFSPIVKDLDRSLEFKGIERQTKSASIQDLGSTRFQLRVRDSDATVKMLKAAGGILTTTGGNGGPIYMRGLRVGIVREPNNLFLVIMTQAR